MTVADQAWVTYANDEETSIKSLVLLKSLKRVLTSKKVVIFVSTKVPSKLRSIIEDEFDSIFPIDAGYETDTNRIKVHCWSLPIFRKCIFLDPNCFVLRNCDEFFDDDGMFVAPTDVNGNWDTTVFSFSPGTKIYRRLREAFADNKPHDIVAAINEFGQFEAQKPNGFLGYEKIDLKNGSVAKNENCLSIIYFENKHPITGDIGGFGMLEKVIGSLWKTIFEKEVEPLLAENNLPPVNMFQVTSEEFGNAPQEPIAIVGMGCRYPGANTIAEFWQLLIEGRDAIRQVTPDRWRKDQGCFVNADTKTTQAGFLNCPIDEFDGKFFGISPVEISFLDPQQRVLLEVIWESLEDSGIDPTSLKNTYTGVYVGEWTNDYKELLRENMKTEFFRTYMGNSPGSAAGRVSFILGLTGPSVATESGCSSAMVAVDLACKSLRLRETNLAIAAGVNLLLHPFGTRDMSMVCAPDGHCKTFDASADGFGRAEGCGSLVLKRFSDAVNDGDHIWAVIRGTGVAQEGPSRSMGTPTVQCESLAMRKALINSGVQPNKISYVETHGTGTPVGDPMEVAAIAQVYAEGRVEPLIIGSVKTNVGHTESCSGITGIMKVVLSLQHETIPPHRNFETLNPHVKLEAVPAEIPLVAKKWAKNETSPRYAGVSSFGITGTDAHAVIQETPNFSQPTLNLGMTRPQHIVTISAKNEPALEELLKSYEKHLGANPELDLADVAFSANTGRAHLHHRVAITGRNTEEIIKKLQDLSYLRQQSPDNKAKICYLFTGQGSQYHNMAKSLYETSPVFRLHFDHCEKVLREKYSVNIKKALWEDDAERSEITRTIYSQTSIFCVEYCLAKLWESYGLKPDFVLGHSLGEFGAACAAGILEVEDAIELVAQRSRLIDSLAGGKMIVVKCSKKNADTILERFYKVDTNDRLDFAAINSNEQTVLAGSSKAVEAFAVLCSNNNIKTHVLGSTHAFHSKDMDPILPEYKGIASNISYGKATCTFISGMDGKVIEDGEINANYWVRHTRESVKFADASKVAFQEGCRVFLEIGPQPVLSALTMSNCGDMGEPIICLPSIRKNEEDWATIIGTMSKLYVNGYDFDWKSMDQYCVRKKVPLPFYPFQRKVHWFETKSSTSGMINGTEIHRLIGCPMPNATATKMYQTSVDLKKEEYIKDHCIGTKIIFPAAGYMEMVLAAGHANTQCCIDSLPTPGTPLTVQTLGIEAPLCINETEACDIQILVSSEDTNSVGTKVSIYRRINSADTSNIKWHRHASGDFSPFAVDYEESSFSFEEIQQRCRQPAELQDFYDKLSQIGLKFGETFRSIKAVKKGDKELVAEVAVPENANDYLCHPVVIDAMIQALMLSNSQTIQRLIVPVRIQKFIWLGKCEDSSKLFVHCDEMRTEGGGGVQASLYDDKGRKLAVMVGAELIETSVEVILSALEQQKLSLPNLYEEAWRATTGPLYGRVTMPSSEIENLVHVDPSGNKIDYNDGWNDQENRVVELNDKLTYCYVTQAFYELGWIPKIGDRFTLKSFISSLSIVGTHEKLTRHFLNTIFIEEGIVQAISGEEWEIVSLPPSVKEISTEISSIHAEIEIHKKKDFQMIAAIGEMLAKIISGKESALGILFPEDPTKVNADVFYTESNVSRVVNRISGDILNTILTNILARQENKDILRFLEIGGGTGSSTKSLLPIIDSSKVKYEYTFTDISQTFFTKARKGFEAYEKNMKYKVLNIEDDPKSQGFIPHNYDFIIASNVVHATRNLSVSVDNLRHLLRNGGMVLLVETNKPLRHVDLIFGVLEGYWIFNDFDIRPNHTVISGTDWETVFKKSAFDSTTSLRCYDEQQTVVIARATSSTPIYRPPAISQERSNTWIILSDENEQCDFFRDKLENVGKLVVVVTASDKFVRVSGKRFEIRREEKNDMELLLQSIQKDEGRQVEGIIYLWGFKNNTKEQNQISQAFLNLAQVLLGHKFKVYPRCYVFTGGIMPVTDQNPCNPSAGSLWGLSRSLRSEQANLTCRCIDSTVDDMSEDRMEELFMEIWNEDGENQVAYRDGKRFVVRFIATKLSFNNLPMPNSNRFALTLPKITKTINDLKFDAKGTFQLQGTEVEVLVKAAALNFRDVFSVLKPDSQFDKSNCVGADFAGVVTRIGPEVKKWRIGDSVIGCDFDGGALPSHVKAASEHALVRLPSKLTFAEGSTLPAVFSTVYYCLVTVGRLQKDEIILIHTASGGVGICAIQLATHLGAKIITTAGSKRKRAFLRETLGIEHVFHSRDLSFGSEIERVTGGRGVDMVLNSITGTGFKETSLNACAQNARFVEMSKLSIWQPEEVQSMRPDVEYTIVDLTAVSKETWACLFSHLSDFLEKEMFRPIPYVRFDGVNVREALTYLQKAKQIGKVVCILPEMKMENGEFVARTLMFNDRSTYIITGGLGGIGIEVAKWMASSGAKHIVLVGRSKPGDLAEKTIQELRGQGINILVENYDVGDVTQCKDLIGKLCSEEMGLPPIRGIMHAAGCLSDAIIINQSWDKFEKTFNAKVKGGWNLHNLTLEFPLEHFVMFSSVVALFGPLGQSNHASANSFLDALAHFRISQGLPATSVNWGQWGQVGVAAGMEVAGLVPFSPNQGIAALEAIMKTQRSQIAVLEADFAAIRRLFPQTKRYVEELKLSVDPGVQVKISSEKFWQEYDSAQENEKTKIVQVYIESILRQILKLDKNEPIDENQNLQEMGLDSLMMVEMKNFLQTLMGSRVTVSASSLQDCHNLVDLTNRLVDLIEGAEEDEGLIIPLTKEELNQLIREDSVLPDHIKPAEKGFCDPNEIRNVLLTGVTGNLAPFILQEISHLEQIKSIFCLIRPNRRLSAMERLKLSLKDKHLEDTTNFEKIQCIEGNLTEPMFGLSEGLYTQLAQDIDGVIHCAVKSNHVEHYRKSEKNKRDIRSINVGGTLRILEFVSTEKTKQLLHSSSMVAVTQSVDQKCPEVYPRPEDFDNMPNVVGYGISKFICDRLMEQATQRGLPIKSLRFPAITGESKTGRGAAIKDNHLMMRVVSYMKMGVMPSIPLPLQVLPVDICAKITVALFLNSDAPYDIYNVTNPRCELEQAIAEVGAEMGHPIKVVEYSEFINKLQKEGGEGSLLEPVKELYVNEETFMALTTSPTLLHSFVLHVSLKKQGDFFRSEKLEKFVPDIVSTMQSSTDILRRDLEYLKNSGVFKKIGLES